MAKDVITLKVPQMESCSRCSGFGVRQSSPDSMPDQCWNCGGSGEVYARDDKGRWLPWKTIEVEISYGEEDGL